MCGIIGIWDYKDSINEGVLREMRDTLTHRGPDASGLFFDKEYNLALGHRRLSIIDLSSAGHQPMERDGLVVTYNGEIYNFLEIRKELEGLGFHFTSNSDTEVLLLAIKQWGEGAVNKFRGMFAFGLWDKNNEKLILCRDRVGVKPLYYYYDGDRFIFASEIKAIIRHPKVNKELDFDSLAAFLRFQRVPAPMSIFKDIYKLEPGHFLEVDKKGVITKKKYWDIVDFAQEANNAEDYNEGKILEDIESKLEEAFKLRMVSDVPVGVFLSGGIDSSLVAAILQRNANTPISTFTIGFEEDGFNEAEYAKKVANYLGTNHHELYLTSENAKKIISKLPEIYDEPFAGASAIPTFFVSEFARSQVTVALSADGGDELFCGYGQRYPRLEQAYRKCARIPTFVSWLARNLPFVERFTKGRLLAAGHNLARIYSAIVDDLSDSDVRRLINKKIDLDYSKSYWKHFDELRGIDITNQFQLFDFKANFPDNILTKVDRASMAVGLESREPFLDPIVMQCAASLPLSLKRKNGIDKYILKKILYKYLPRDLVDRRKHGFSAPIREWLRGDLKYLLDEYLDEDRIKKEGILNSEEVAKEKRRFLAGQTESATVWSLLVFQMWKERWNL